VSKDRNFDKLAELFEKRIYGSVKGKLRLELLREDLAFLRDGKKMNIFDAGCGMGQMALWFSKAGHKTVGCDISSKMLEKARAAFESEGLEATLLNEPAQKIAPAMPPQDLVLVHALLEWLAEPADTLQTLAECVKPGGYLSVLFFNLNSFVYRNILHGTWRFKYILDESWIGKGKKLTPPHPQKPEEILSWLHSRDFEIVCHTGIRVFHDYIMKDVLQKSDLEELLALERRYCREVTFRNMGRYIHILAKRVHKNS
jgi:S-adenosylmethionine-dependent methyltransferase